MRVHFIAIGGSAMHNLAIALHLRGDIVTGSDDEIFDPAKKRLQKYGLLPDKTGWFPEKINNNIDIVILGMHSRINNPELIEAQRLKLKIFSYPEFIYEAGRDKIRVVVGGSHGKTTITSMIIHVFQQLNINCDYMVGAQLKGFEVMVKLSNNANFIIIEGDEYLTSPVDKRPKFHLYKPNIGIISGIAWDHVNVFPTFEIYKQQFQIFAEMIDSKGAFIYNENDRNVKNIAFKIKNTKLLPYKEHAHFIKDGTTYLKTEFGDIALHIFGKHNLENLNAAKFACNCTGISDHDFYQSISSFNGASKRLELIAESDTRKVFKDFAHSPSKLKATIEAVKFQFPDYKLIACMELHTYSSLTSEFLKQYNGCVNMADVAFVYFNEEAVKHKKLPKLTPETIFSSFGDSKVHVFNNSLLLVQNLMEFDTNCNSVFLIMSSGNFDGIDIDMLGKELICL